MTMFKNLGYYDKIAEAEAAGLWKNVCSDDSEEAIKQIECYQCEVMNLDYAIQLLIERLEETNQLDNTLIILYGDHEIYYKTRLDKPLAYYMYDVDDEAYPFLYQTTLIMYNKKLSKHMRKVNGLDDDQKIEFTDFTSPYVIVPTTLELLGVKYNQRYYIGTSIFQIKTSLDNIFYSNEYSTYFSNKIYSSDGERFEYLADDASEEYQLLFNQKCMNLLNKIDKFSKAYQQRYFDE